MLPMRMGNRIVAPDRLKVHPARHFDSEYSP